MRTYLGILKTACRIKKSGGDKMDNKPKLCVDCKHYRDERKGGNNGEYNYGQYCYRKGYERISLVDGQPEMVGPLSCYTERYFGRNEDCGPEGKYWEPKEGK